MTAKRIKLTALIIIASASWLLASCSIFGGDSTATPLSFLATTAAPTRTATSTPTPTEVVIRGTISIWHGWEDLRAQALLRTIANFQQIYPDVQFDVQYIPSIDLKNSYKNAFQQGREPTLLIGPASWGPEFFDLGMIADLSGQLPAEMVNAVNPAAMTAGSYRGAQLGLPLSIQGVVLYRNQTIIPIESTTFQDLVEFAGRATEGETIGAILDRSLYFSGGHLYGLGGSFLDSEGNPTFNSPAGLAWIGLLRDYERIGPTEYFGDGDLDLFKEGKVGLITESTARRGELAQAVGEANLAIDPWPLRESGTMAGFVEAELIFASPVAFEQQNQIAWLFAKTFLSSEAQTAIAQSGVIPAANASIIPSGVTRVQVDDRLTREAMLALVDGVAYPVHPAFQYYTGPLDVALSSIFFNQADPALALENAEQAVLEAIAFATQTPTLTPTPIREATPTP